MNKYLIILIIGLVPLTVLGSGVSSFNLQIAPSGIPEAQVIINSITDNTVSSIVANATITNESTLDYEYLYEWCVVSSEDNECGGGDDIFASSASKFILAGEDFNTNLNAVVPDIGDYWFKLIVYWDSQESGSYITFTAEQDGDGGDDGDDGGGGGGGGGGGPLPPLITKVIFQGIAYPLAQITILKDGGKIKTVKANSKANFKAEITNITAGNYVFGIWAKDTEERRSITLSYPAEVQTGRTRTISNIFFSPTISFKENSVKQGEILEISGQSVPEAEIFLFINPGDITRETISQKQGKWTYSFNTGILKEDIYNVKAKSQVKNLTSFFSRVLFFGVGRVVTDEEICLKADFSSDDKINLVDFSIFLYWWGKANFQVDLNQNGIVDLADFSIFLYCWTG